MEIKIVLKDNIDKSCAGLLFDLADALRGGDIFEEDYETALALFKEAIKAGDVRGYGKIGEILSELGSSKAVIYFKKGAAMGDVASMAALGRIYEEEGNLEAARMCFERAAQEGDPEAMYRYGLMILEAEEKISWLRKAADKGYLYAPRALGEIYEMKENENLALFWYRQGLALGDSSVKDRVAVLEANGDEEIDVVIEYDDEETM